MAKRRAFGSPEVAAVFAAYPENVRARLLHLRQLIFDVASRTAGVGRLEETLKWGQPSYLTTETKSGSLVRIDQVSSQDGRYAIYFHCQTTLVDTFREMFRGVFEFGGNRCIVFGAGDDVPVKELRHCIAMALTYHRNKTRIRSRPQSRRTTHRSSVGPDKARR
jgi:hypothetical protein